MADPACDADVAVVGAGPAGLAAAAALADAGLDTLLIGPAPNAESLARETRTTALFGGSIELLRHLGVWPALRKKASPLRGLRLIDDTGSLLRAPETLFQAHEIGRDAFGYNVANTDLIEALYGACCAAPRLRLMSQTVEHVTLDVGSVRLVGDQGHDTTVRLVAAADGRRSKCRSAAGAVAKEWAYPQVAVATRFHHTRPHEDISTELHRRAGPLTTVPMLGRESSLVWVETPQEADRLMALDDDRFAGELEGRLQGLLGGITAISPRARFPLAGMTAKPLAQKRIALIGEAGHMLPPIGAQGLNLGFRDAAWIAELAGNAKAEGRDVGGDEVMRSYCKARETDIATRSTAVDLLNRSLLAGFLPVDMLRGAGLALLSAVPWLRRSVMASGIGPGGPEPRLLRGAGL